jgi:hypothetical protein
MGGETFGLSPEAWDETTGAASRLPVGPGPGGHSRPRLDPEADDAVNRQARAVLEVD